jgi:hypothetical protein
MSPTINAPAGNGAIPPLARPVGTDFHAPERHADLASIAGLLAVVAGLLALIAVSVAAIVVLPRGNGQNVVAVATGSFGVIGTVVGAYFGVKLGADGRQAANQAQRVEAAKVQALAAHMDAGEATAALREAGHLAPPHR